MSKKNFVKKVTEELSKKMSKKTTLDDVQVVVEANSKFGLEFYPVNP